MSALTLTLNSTAPAALAYGTFTASGIAVAGTINPVLATPTLAAGFNQFTVPASCVGVVIAPPVANTAQLRASGNIGISGTVTLTAGGGIVTATAIGTAGSGYQNSSVFLAAPVQSGGSGCVFLVTTGSTGIPTATTFLTGKGGTGYTSATVPWVIADLGVNIPLATPSTFFFEPTYLPTTFLLWSSALHTATTQLVFF